ALATLVADYAVDPRARAGLRIVASDDPSEFVRALANYVVSGVDAWRSYVRETVKNDGLTAAEKVRPLVYTSDDASEAFRKVALAVLANDTEIQEAVLALGREYISDTSVQQRGPVRRALYALTRPESGPVTPGSRRADLQALYYEYSPGVQRQI